MNLLNYFKKTSASVRVSGQAIPLPTAEDTGLNQNTIDQINQNVTTLKPKKKRTIYTPTQRALIGRYASEGSVNSTYRKFRKEFPQLGESAIK